MNSFKFIYDQKNDQSRIFLKFNRNFHTLLLKEDFMRLFKGVLIISCFILFIGCSKTGDVLSQSSTQDIQDYLDQQQTGFIIITNETNASFLDEVQSILLEKKKQTAKLFNVFYNDSKKKNSDGLSKNPFNFEMPSVNSIYYIKDGKVSEEYDLEVYTGLEQEKELNHFLDVNERVTQYE